MAHIGKSTVRPYGSAMVCHIPLLDVGLGLDGLMEKCEATNMDSQILVFFFIVMKSMGKIRKKKKHQLNKSKILKLTKVQPIFLIFSKNVLFRSCTFSRF